MAYRVTFPIVGEARFERDGELARVGEERFILANIELPVEKRTDQIFVWTCWVSLSRQSYDRMKATWFDFRRDKQEPVFGFVCNSLPTYEPTTSLLKAHVHNRVVGVRPAIELEPTDHPLAIEQRAGISADRIAAIFHFFEDQVERDTKR